MIVVRYAICSTRAAKPLTRLVADTLQDAERALERLRQQELSDPEDAYWIAELGPECDAWRELGQPDGVTR